MSRSTPGLSSAAPLQGDAQGTAEPRNSPKFRPPSQLLDGLEVIFQPFFSSAESEKAIAASGPGKLRQIRRHKSALFASLRLFPTPFPVPNPGGSWAGTGWAGFPWLLQRAALPPFPWGIFFPPLLFAVVPKRLFCGCANAVTFPGAARSSGCSPACQGDEGIRETREFGSSVRTPGPQGSGAQPRRR